MGLALAIVLHLAGVLIPVMAFAMIGYAAAGLFAGAAIPLILTIGYKECADCQSTVSVVFFVSISMGPVSYTHLGMASAVGWILFLMILVVSLIQFRIFKEE